MRPVPALARDAEPARAVRRCPTCGARARAWIDVPGDFRAPGAPVRYRIARCDECELGFLEGAPADVRRRARADTPFEPAFPGRWSGPGAIDRALMAIARRLDPGGDIDVPYVRRRFGHAKLRVCDVGCGEGALLQRIAPLGHERVGLEPDRRAAKVAASLGIEVHRATVEAPPARLARSFDVVFMLHVLEHCADVDRAIAGAASLLAPGGTLVVEVPNCEARGLAWSRAAWLFLDVPRHVRFFTARGLERAVARAGLEVAEVAHVGLARQLSAPWVEQEQRIWDRLAALPGARAQLGPRPSHARANALFARTLLDPRSRSCDSVRVFARAPR